MYKRLCLFALSVLVSATLFAQTKPAAEGAGGGLVWVGAEISTFNPDYGCLNSSPFSCWNYQLLGISPYIDSGSLFFPRLTLESQARFLHWRGPGLTTESTYMAGPRFRLYRYKTVTLSGKFLIGKAHMTLAAKDPGPGAGSYLAYAPGILVDYRLAYRWSLRADYEQQFWPNFKGIPTKTTTGTGGLTPEGLSLGFSYAIR